MAADDPTDPSPAQAVPQFPSLPSVPRPPGGIQKAPGSEGTVPLPPPPRVELPPPPESFLRLLGRLDAVLVAVVLLFAFLTASFKIGNADFLQHLAVGRLIAHGEHQFGVDPFTFTSEGKYWVNHSWLFDLAAYALYEIPQYGGAVLVVLKGLLVLLLAEVMLRTGSKPGQRLWIPAVCTALAILALSPRLLMGPEVVSYLFLALTVWLLRRQPADTPSPAAALARPSFWALPALFLLWVNLDDWFILGPATVALYLLGEVLAQNIPALGAGGKGREPAADVRVLALTLLAGVAACLVNPHFVSAFQLPPQLGFSEAGRVLRQSALYQGVFLRPFDERYFNPATGPVVAALAYFPLVLLGLVSFVLRKNLLDWRLTVWVGFFLLSLALARAIPFFAVVAGPLTALNLLDIAEERVGASWWNDFIGRRWSVGGRVLTLALGAWLLVATVPGWLQGRTGERRVGWGVELDPSLERMARQVAAWRHEGKIGAEARLFNHIPTVANYLAWFSPGAKGYLDLRLPLYSAEVADGLVDTYRALTYDREFPGPLWRDVFRRWGIRFVVLASGTQQELEARTLGHLLSAPDEWVLLYLDGRTLLFGWKDPEGGPDPEFESLRLDPDRLAFGPDAVKAPPPPESLLSPAEPAAPAPWYESFLKALGDYWKAEPRRSLDTDESQMYRVYFDVEGPRYAKETALAGQGAVVAGWCAAGAGGPAPNWMGNALQAQVAAQWLTLGLFREKGPPAALYLAVRAARRAIAENPADAQAHLQLGWAYYAMMSRTREFAQGVAVPYLALIRQSQAIAALEKAVQLNPDLVQAHDILGRIYQGVLQPDPSRGVAPSAYPDMVLKHREELLRCLQAGLVKEANVQQLQEFDASLQELRKEVKQKQDVFLSAKANQSPRQQAMSASRSGLAETTLNTLQKVAVDELAGAGGGKQPPGDLLAEAIRLALALGRLDEAHYLLTEQVKPLLPPVPGLGLPAYEWYSTLLAAASGDYASADKFLAQATERAVREPGPFILASMRVFLPPEARRPQIPVTTVVPMLVGQMLLAKATQATHLPLLEGIPTGDMYGGQAAQVGQTLLEQEADLLVSRGYVALEAGDMVGARAHFQKALEITGPPGEPLSQDIRVPFRGRQLAHIGLDRLDRAAKK